MCVITRKVEDIDCYSKDLVVGSRENINCMLRAETMKDNRLLNLHPNELRQVALV